MAHTGLIQSYTNTEAQKRMITDRILLASPYDVSTILALGLDNTAKFQFVNTPGRKYEWLEDSYNPVTDVASNEFTSSTTTTTFTPDTISLYQPGDVIKLDDELMWVSAVAAHLTVVRGFGDTTPATHVNDSVITIVGSARLEGDDADNSPSSIFTTGYNYSTILQKSVNISRTDILLPNYGVSNLKEYYIDKNMDELMERLDKLPFYGKRSIGTATTARMSGGIDTFVTTNVTNAAGAALTRKMIDDILVKIWDAGGKGNLIITSSWAKRKINSFYEDFVRTERTESMGGMSITSLEHPLGGEPISIIVDRHCQSNRLYCLSTDNVGYITIDPFFYEELAKTGDSEKGQTIGEYGFVCQFEKSHGYIHTFSTTV